MSSARPELFRALALAGSVALVAALALWALTVGAAALTPADLLAALQSPEGQDRASVVLWQVRMPRLLGALAAGAGLAVAGAIMQALTGNPLADPGLLGVNAGAAFAVVLAVTLTGGMAGHAMVWTAFLGAAAAAVLVYVLGSIGRSGATPIKLVLAGAILSGFLLSLTTAMLMVDLQTLEEVRFWTQGSLKNRKITNLTPVLPYLGAGLVAAMLVRSQFTSLSLGAEIAAGLGQNQPLWRVVSAVVVVALAGSAVSMAGPVCFVGLVVPHIVRLSVGADYRWILPFCVTGGAGLMLLADTLPRALWTRDIPVGVTLALLGAPFFIWLARRRTGRSSPTMRTT